MSQSTQSIPFDSKTDKLEAITHIVNQLLTETTGELQLQYARTQTLETLQETDPDSTQDFDGDDFDDIIANNGNFSVSKGQFDQQTITNVQTTGRRPAWLGISDSASATTPSTPDGVDIDALQTTADADADFSQLDCLTDHQPDALKEAGFNSFRDLYEADTDALVDVPGVKQGTATDIQAEAKTHINPVVDIAQEAYEAEMEAHRDSGDNATDSEVADSHLITDVKIPAGKPRGPEFSGTNMPRRIYSLPVLERPTLSVDSFADIASEADDLTELVESVRSLLQYDVQTEGFRNAISDTFDDIEDVHDTTAHPRDVPAIESVITQPGVTGEQLRNAITAHEDLTVTQDSINDVVNTIDLELEDEAPTKSRLNLVAAMRRELQHTPDVSALLDDQTIDDLIAASAAPAEVDHPFIEDIDDYPPLKTRTLETGEQDVEAAARIVAKNNYALDLIGHAGVGKDTLMKFLAALTNRPIIVINMDESMISQDLMGIHKIDETGKIIFKDGVIPHTAKYGIWLVISEVNAAAPEILTAFHQLLERDSKLHIKERDEVIEPSPKFRISTTRNPPTEDYGGAKELNSAFKRRLNSVWLSYLDKPEEVDLIDSIVNSDRQVIDRDDIETLVEMTNDFRESAEESFEFPRLSTSEILHIIDMYDGADDLLGASKETIKANLNPTMHKEEACMNAIEDHF